MKEEKDAMTVRVFISHQWTDKQLADRLARDLEPFADVWMDYRNLRPGDRIQPTIDTALEGTDLVLVIWTEYASRSAGVAEEIRTCLELGLRIVPCISDYDASGNPHPPLPDELSQVLGVDFHHFGSGLAQLADYIVHIQRSRLPEEAAMDGHPAVRMMEYLRGYLSYLANYRKIRGVRDERSEWVDRIITEIERYVASGGDRQSVRLLLEAARDSTVDDVEGIGMLVSRLEQLLDEGTGGPGDFSFYPRPAMSGSGMAWQKPPAPPRDELARRVAAVVAPADADVFLRQVEAYIDSAPVALQALEAYALSAHSAAGVQVVQYLQGYLATADDLIPAHHGRYGLLDDAWLILNTTFRLIESGLLPASAVPLDWPTIAAADYVVRAIIPSGALETLTSAVFQLLQIIAAEVASYQPWFTPHDHGYAPTMAAPRSAGGTWEDQMNEALLGTGLSV